MRFVFSSENGCTSFSIEFDSGEVVGIDDLRNLSDGFRSEVRDAYEAARMVFERFPAFRQLTLDTFTDGERAMMMMAGNAKEN